jgi:glycosyltransferase involved in cell wall biosynthesis
MLRHDILISRDFPPYVMALFFKKRFVLDLYVAFPIEWNALSQRIPDPTRRRLWMEARRHHIEAQLTLADHITCSDERQRDFWVGSLIALGLIQPQTYERDRTLERLIAVAPYGVQQGSPSSKRKVLKGVVPGIRKTDTVLIWNGSIMEWFDAKTVIRAMAEIVKVRDDIKLFFLGLEHPDFVTGMLFDPPRDAVELSKQLGLHDSTVFFHHEWVPYGEIGAYLAEADIGVCAGFDSMETRYAFRTRFVDLFWAELPIVCTRGDVLAERVERDQLGVVVEPGDVEGFAAGILRLVDDRAYYDSSRANMSAVKQDLSWERVLTPLLEFCRAGTSIAQPKGQRFPHLVGHNVMSFLTLLERSAEYAVTSLRSRLGRESR